MSYTTKQGLMPWEVYTNTIDEIKKGTDKKLKLFLQVVRLCGTLKFVDMLKYAKENGVYRSRTTTIPLRYMKRHWPFTLCGCLLP